MVSSRKQLTRDFTQGSIPKQLWWFMLPFMASNALQVLYSTIDMIIVGAYVGTEGLSAVAQSSQILNFATMVSLGFSNAGQVLIAQALGAGKKKEMSRIVGTLTSLILLLALLSVGISFQMLTKNFLTEKVIDRLKSDGKTIAQVAAAYYRDKANALATQVKRDSKGNVEDIAADYAAPADYVASMDIFVLNKKFLMEQIKEHIAHNRFHMDRDLVLGGWQAGKVSVNVYPFEGIALFNESIAEYFQNSLSLIKKDVRDDIFGGNHPVFTKVRDRVPTYYGEDCEIEDSLIADGCMIDGEVEDSVLFRQVTICEDAEVEDCVIMNDTVVGEGSELKYVILDKDVTVTPGAVLVGTKPVSYTHLTLPTILLV